MVVIKEVDVKGNDKGIYTAKIDCYFKHIYGYLSCMFTDIVFYSSTIYIHECLCGISTKELLQCVFLIISNCLWNLAITTVTNRT